ncbi:allantoicase-like isoform X2 [Argopecten irradians]|uniref:allantoicase-like isoform X2 n=1 Tax=Argopecten irradians TaxID=31199 RepID=UPI00372063BF
MFKEGLFTEFGKWMDGWETRRKRMAGHDWCIIQLGLPDRLSEMGTEATIQEITETAKLKSEDWTEILSKTPLRPGYLTSCHNYFEIHNRSRWTHLRINMFPDGGIARLRVYGRAKRDWSCVPHDQVILAQYYGHRTYSEFNELSKTIYLVLNSSQTGEGGPLMTL